MMSIGTPDDSVRSAAMFTAPGSRVCPDATKRWRRSFGVGPNLAPQISRIDRAVQERDLVVIGVVESLRQRVRGAEAVAAGERPIDRQHQGVVFRPGARFDVHHAIGPADHRIEHFADGSTDQEMGSPVVDNVDAGARTEDRLLDAEVKFLDHRVLQVRVDDIDARGAGSRQDEARERVRDRWRERRQPASVRIEEEHVAGPDFDGQRPAVQTALERLNLQHDPVVVDPISAAHQQPVVRRRPGKSDTWREVVRVTGSFACYERKHDRVEIADPALIVDLGIDLISQSEIQLQTARHAPVVLQKPGDVCVVGVRKVQRLIRLSAAQRDGEQQIVVVNAAVARMVERREVLDQLDPALLKHAKPKLTIHPVELAAEPHVVRATDEGRAVGDLPPRLRRPLGHSKRGAVLQARKGELRGGGERGGLVEKRADTHVERIDEAR